MNLVTGATGLLGSHICERLVQAGQPVRVLIRPTSDASFLDSLKVDKFVGDLTDPNSCHAACDGVDVVYHAAAQVGDWGPWDAFQKHTIDATDNIARAALMVNVRCFVHISSISAYGHPNGRDLLLDETAPLGANVHRWSYYTRAKVAAEKLLWRMHAEAGLPLIVIRPSWIYGPRDRTSIARLHRMITTGRIKILGSGDNYLNTVYAPNVADACLLAVSHADKAVGQAYNVSNDGRITQRQYLAKWARAFGCAEPTRHVPYWLAYSLGFDCEALGRLLRRRKPPFITRYSVWLMGRDVYFSVDKARRDLDWHSRVSYDEGIKLTAQWYLQQLGK